MSFKQHLLFKLLSKFELQLGQYVIAGSGIMYALGINPANGLRDLDVILTPNVFLRVAQDYSPTYDEEWNCKNLKLFGGEIEFSDGWGPGRWDVHDLILNAKVIEGYPFMSLPDLVKWKQQMGRPKDLQHLEMIQNYLDQ